MFAKIMLQRVRESSLWQCLIFLLLLIGTFAMTVPTFLTALNIGNIFTSSAVLGLMAAGATFVIACGAIDLSTASTMALSSVVCAWAAQHLHIAGVSTMVIATVCGATCGLLTGILINTTKAPSFIITLGMLSIYRALAYIITGGVPIYGLDEAITRLADAQYYGISAPTIILFAAMISGFVILSTTRFGAHTLLLGDNPQAAEAMGLDVGRLRLLIFTLAGSYSGLAGFMFTARTNSGDPSGGMSYELSAITAVVLGGANLFGGRASVQGTLAGLLCLTVLQNGLNLMAIGTFYQTLFIGVVLVVASFLRRLSLSK